jgi:hypothetical protein
MSGTQHMRLFVAGGFLLALLAPAVAHANSVLVIETTTSSLSGSRGYIDLQYQGNAGAGASTATITGFSTDGSLGGAATISSFGDATGNLASTVTIQNGALNSSGYNDFNQAITFGTLVDFMVTLSDPVGGAANSAFTLSYYASDDETPLLSADPSGASAQLTIEPNGTVLPATYADANGRYDSTINETSPVPEPSSVLFAATGMALLAGGAARNRRRARARQLL